MRILLCLLLCYFCCNMKRYKPHARAQTDEHHTHIFKCILHVTYLLHVQPMHANTHANVLTQLSQVDDIAIYHSHAHTDTRVQHTHTLFFSLDTHTPTHTQTDSQHTRWIWAWCSCNVLAHLTDVVNILHTRTKLTHTNTHMQQIEVVKYHHVPLSSMYIHIHTHTLTSRILLNVKLIHTSTRTCAAY